MKPLQTLINERQEFKDIAETLEDGLLILSPASGKAKRRILYVNSYGGPQLWRKVRQGFVPTHHLWGCVELVGLGYQVGIADALQFFSLRQNPIPPDLRLWRHVQGWLRPDDILFSGHTLLYAVPILRAFRAIKCRIVSLTYAREKLDFPQWHSGVVAMTPAAADQVRKKAPKVKVAHLGWGMDLSFFPRLPYQPEWFLSSGRTLRDHSTLCSAAKQTREAIRVIVSGSAREISWPANVVAIDGVPGKITDGSPVSFRDFLVRHNSGNACTLVVIKRDPNEQTANGFTNLLESMAMGRPAIVTRTGATPGEIDVEATGCGLHVPAGDAAALAAAIAEMAADRGCAQAMGEQGRRLVESHYTVNRFAVRLDDFFESI